MMAQGCRPGKQAADTYRVVQEICFALTLRLRLRLRQTTLLPGQLHMRQARMFLLWHVGDMQHMHSTSQVSINSCVNGALTVCACMGL